MKTGWRTYCLFNWLDTSMIRKVMLLKTCYFRWISCQSHDIVCSSFYWVVCVCVGVLLCLQQFSKSLKISLGGARLIELPISIVHVNCRGVEHILNLMLFLIDIFRQNRVTEIKSCLTTFKLITQNRQIQERCYPPKPRNEPGDSFQHIPSSIGTKKTFNNLYRYILLCFFRWNI